MSWKASVEEHLHMLDLPVNEVETLKSMGNQLGLADEQVQIRLLDVYLEHLGRTIDDLQEEYKNKTKLYHCLGIMGGLLVSILLF